MNIQPWVPGTFPIPFFQTWCCKNSSVTPSMVFSSSGVDKNDLWLALKNAGLPPKMYECVSNNLRLNRVGVDCIHYLFHDAECRAFIAREFPDDVLYAYDQLIPTAFKADLWRYCVLYKYGGVYLDIKLGFLGGGYGDGDGDGDMTLRSIVERWLRGGGDELLVLERDSLGLWPTGRFGIHNAFMIVKPKNPILLECIYRIVSASKIGSLGDGFDSDASVGWMTRPLFVTGPGLLGDVWRSIRWGAPPPMKNADGGLTAPNSYVTMIPYFRLYFEGNGIISYYIEPKSCKKEFGKYLRLLKVYDEYPFETVGCSNVPHYTVLWSRGVVWKGVPPPNDGI
jgi:hypothetical protein